MSQLTLGLGTTHICRDVGLPSWGCGKAWDCGEPDCQLGEHQLGPCCMSPFRDHARVMLNRAKREQIVQVRLARITNSCSARGPQYSRPATA